jgi:hypothetical protein
LPKTLNQWKMSSLSKRGRSKSNSASSIASAWPPRSLTKIWCKSLAATEMSWCKKQVKRPRRMKESLWALTDLPFCIWARTRPSWFLKVNLLFCNVKDLQEQQLFRMLKEKIKSMWVTKQFQLKFSLLSRSTEPRSLIFQVEDSNVC